MAEARSRHEWRLASSLIAMVHNVNCTDRDDQRPPQHFDPHAAADRNGNRRAGTGKPARVSVRALKGLFVKE